MGAKFRVDDVVVESFGLSKIEGRVERVVLNHGEQVVSVRWPSGVLEPSWPQRLRLVRRPVQPGDRLRDTRESQRAFAGTARAVFADAAGDRCVRYEEGGWAYLFNLEHEDGTPIDFRGSLATTAREAALAAFSRGSSTIEHPELAPSRRIDFDPGSNARRLAWGLFATDPEVLAFVAERSDAVCRATTHETRLEYEGRPSTISVTVEKVDDKRRKRVLEIAWERDENGWRDRAEKRAAEIIAAMGATDG